MSAWRQLSEDDHPEPGDRIDVIRYSVFTSGESPVGSRAFFKAGTCYRSPGIEGVGGLGVHREELLVLDDLAPEILALEGEPEPPPMGAEADVIWWRPA